MAGALVMARAFVVCCWKLRAQSAAQAIKVKFASPTLTSPANGDTNVPVRPTFTWSSANGLWKFYTLQIAPDNTFG